MLNSTHTSFGRLWVPVLLLLLTILLASTASAGTLIVNGDFESLTSPNSLGTNGGYICQFGTSCTSNLVGWASTCDNNSCGTSTTVASILYANTNGAAFNGGIGLWGTIPNSPTGGNFLAIDGDPTYSASISQVLTLAPGIYTLTFYQAAAQQKGTTGNNTEQWQVTLGGVTQKSTLMSNPSQGVQPWTKQTMTFTVNSANPTLTFLALGTPNGGPPVVLLDGVSLVATPEPSTFLLLGGGLAGVFVLTRRRQQQKP